jgi:hypothetical protein
MGKRSGRFPRAHTNEGLDMNRNARIVRSGLTLVVAGLLVTGVAACGSSSDTAVSTAATATAGTTAGATTPSGTVPAQATLVAVTMGSPKEFSMVPAVTSAPAGKVTFDVTNAGTMVHEFVVVKTTKDAGKLPVTDGEASETGAVGEIADMKAGAEKRVTLTLAAGHYALICNLAGHYLGGMYANFDVK